MASDILIGEFTVNLSYYILWFILMGSIVNWSLGNIGLCFHSGREARRKVFLHFLSFRCHIHDIVELLSILFQLSHQYLVEVLHVVPQVFIHLHYCDRCFALSFPYFHYFILNDIFQVSVMMQQAIPNFYTRNNQLLYRHSMKWLCNADSEWAVTI